MFRRPILIQVVFGKTLLPEEVEETVGGLVAAKIISLSEKGEVDYKMMAAAIPIKPAKVDPAYASSLLGLGLAP